MAFRYCHLVLFAKYARFTERQQGGHVDWHACGEFFFCHFDDSIITDVAQPFVPGFKVRDCMSYVCMLHPNVLGSEQVEAFIDSVSIRDDFESLV